MYVQITNLCNMECPHCSYSCGPYKEHTHMDLDTFTRTLSVLEDTGCYHLNIGGGEPTVHPRFWEFLEHAALYADEDSFNVWLATNGKRPTDAMLLAALGAWPESIEPLLEIADTLYSGDEPVGQLLRDKGLALIDHDQWKAFTCTLSVDQWHDPIPKAVVDAFKHAGMEVRDVGYNLAPQGRAIDIVGDTPNPDGLHCPCPVPWMDPNGNINVCGCADAPTIGNIHDEDIDEALSLLFEAGDGCYRDTDMGVISALNV